MPNKNIEKMHVVFDLGGVVFRLDKSIAIERFKEIGVANVEEFLDDYAQKGIFGDLEAGKLTARQYRDELSRITGKQLTMEELEYAWTGYAAELYQRNFDALLQLRHEGFQVALLSNTNPFMMRWARSNAFDGNGHGLDYYFDRLYLSYEMHMMKPAPEIFKAMIDGELTKPENILFIDDSARNCQAAATLGIKTLNPGNGSDWRHDVYTSIGLTE
ncbi:MAG: HAD family phosphatase [Muribaculaceae bacterium]|nr:HAD family phosphatase [Muribaculaceae bacterium]